MNAKKLKDDLKKEIKESKVGVKEFNKPTPPIIYKIGQVMLVIGGAGGIVAPFNPVAGAIISVIGIAGKAITKLFS